MKTSFLAIAFAVASMPMIFAAQAGQNPPAKAQAAPNTTTQTETTTKTTKKHVKKHSKKAPKTQAPKSGFQPAK